MASEFDYVNGAVSLLLSVGTAVVNIPLVIFLASTCKNDDDVIPVVMFSMTISDLFVGTFANIITAILAWAKPIVVPNALLVVQGSVFHACTFISIWHLALMSTFKCYIISRPLTHSAVLTNRLRNVVVVAIWIINFVIVVVDNVFGVRWLLDPTMSSSVPTGNPAAAKGMRYFESGVMFVVPSVAILTAYLKILFIVRKHHRTIGQVTTDGLSLDTSPVAHVQGWSASIRSARSIFFICFAFYICYIPVQFNNVGFLIPAWYQIGSKWLLYISYPMNGLLYILLYKSTRQKFWRKLFRRATVQNETSMHIQTINEHINV